jgi:hypothetical protein
LTRPSMRQSPTSTASACAIRWPSRESLLSLTRGYSNGKMD